MDVLFSSLIKSVSAKLTLRVLNRLSDALNDVVPPDKVIVIPPVLAEWNDHNDGTKLSGSTGSENTTSK